MENELTILDDKYILKEIISQTKNSKIYIGNLVSEPLNQIIINWVKLWIRYKKLIALKDLKNTL